MDRRRRRYIPGSENLEGRQLLSTASPAAAIAGANVVDSTAMASPAAQEVETTSTTTASQVAARNQIPVRANRPPTPGEIRAHEELIELRLQRIDRLPNFLQLLDPNRQLPEEAVSAIQDELRLMVGQLQPPAQPIAEGFIDQLRNAIAQSSVREQNIASMNFATDRLLTSAGASERSVQVITEGLTALSRTAAGSNRPVPVMTNDYALVVQTALGVGRPISRAELFGFQSPFGPQGVGSRGPMGLPGNNGLS